MSFITTAFIVSLAVSSALSIGLQILSSALRPKPQTDTGAIDAGSLVNTSLTFGAPRGVLIGTREVGGDETDRFSYGDRGEFLVGIQVLSSRPCTGFQSLKVFGEEVTLAGDPTVSEVAVTSHFLGIDDQQRMFVRVFLGEDNSGFPAYINGMTAGRYDATDTGGKMCIAVWRAHHTNDDIDDDGESHIPWNSGPPVCRWEMRGARMFDPRVAGASYDNEATWVYSDNPLIQDFAIDLGFRDGLAGTPNEQVTIGNGYPQGLLDIDHVIEHSNWADTRPYTCHGVVRSGETGDQDEVWKSFNGQRLERPASVLTMPEANRPFYGTVDISDNPAAKVVEYDEYGESTEVLNRMHGFYVEPIESYARKDLPAYTRPEWTEADDFIPREDELGLHFVTSGTQALELIKQEAEITRHPATLRIADINMDYGETPLGVLIDLDGTDIPAINGRRWVVEQVLMSSEGSVSFALRDSPAADRLLLQTTDVQPYTPVAPESRPWPWWDPAQTVPSAIVGNIQGMLEGTVVFEDIVIGGFGSVTSQAQVTNMNITELSTDVGNSGSLSASKSPAFAFADGNAGQTVTTNSVTVAPTGGTAPYSYSWTYVSGDSFNINSPSAASTSFLGTIPVNGVREGLYNCTVTDSSSPPESSSVIVGVSAVSLI